MKTIGAWVLTLLLAGNVTAEVSLPYGITPLNGEIRLLYRPGFESTCISKNDSDPKDVPIESITKLYIDPVGRLKFEIKMDDFSVTADIHHDGSAVARGSLQFRTEDQTTNGSIPDILKNEFFSKMLSSLEKTHITNSPIGKSLRQNSDLSTGDFCEVIPGARSSFFSKFKKNVAGIAQIHGRPSLILKSDINTSCSIDTIGKMEISGYAWESFDLQSGLNSDSGGNMSFKMGSDTGLDMKVVSSCVITDMTQANSSNGTKSLEGRLSELKALMEKGLITQEQYEQKRADILKAL